MKHIINAFTWSHISNIIKDESVEGKHGSIHNKNPHIKQ